MSILGFLSFGVFALLCLVGAGIVLLYRPDAQRGLTYWPLLWAMSLPALVFALLAVGSYSEYGRRLTLSVSELRIPLTGARSDGTYFIVGPRPDTSDLVVGPYAGIDQSEEAYRPEFEGLLTVKRDRALWRVCGKQIAPDADANLPGMQVRFDDQQTPTQACPVLGEAPVKAVIERLDAGKAKPSTRRTLLISLTPNAVRIALKDDEQLVRHWGRCADGEETLAAGMASLRLAPAGLHRDDLGYRVPENLVFGQLGRGGKNPLLAPERLGPVTQRPLASLCDALTTRFTWPAADTGEEADSEANARMVLTSRSTAIALWIGWLVAGVCLTLARVCYKEWNVARGRTEAGLVLALVWLLTLRLLVALSGLPNEPGLDLAGLMWPPAMALVCVPLMAVALARGYREGTARDMLLLAAMLAVAALFIGWSLDWHWPDKQELGLVFVTGVLLLARGLITYNRPLVAVLLDHAGAAGGWLARLGVPLWNRLRDLAPRLRMPDAATAAAAVKDPFIAGFVLAIAIFAVRLIVALIGRSGGGEPVWQERFNDLPGIGNLPISLIYAPLAIVAAALMITGYRSQPNPLRAVLLAGAFAAVFLGIGIVVKDLGIILIFAVPVGWAIAKLVRVPLPGRRIPTLGARGLLLMPLLSPFLLLAGYFAVYGLTPVLAPGEDLAGHMRAVTRWDTNLARLQRFVDADRLVDIGSNAAFETLEQAAQLEPITEARFGRGYLEPSGVVAPLLKYQHSDNLLAVQIAWPFGRMGLAALLGGLVMMLIGLRGTRASPPGSHWLWQASTLAATTVFWSGAYMALANLNLVPFTGRNFYLLATRSSGDLAEGFVLLLMVVLPFLVLTAQPVTPKPQQPRLQARPEVWLALAVGVAIMFVPRTALLRDPALAMQEGRGYRGTADTLARLGCIRLAEGRDDSARARLEPDEGSADCPTAALFAKYRASSLLEEYRETTLFDEYRKATPLGGDMANLVETRWQFDQWTQTNTVIAIRANTHRLRFGNDPRTDWGGAIVAAVQSKAADTRLWSDGEQVRQTLADCADKRIDGMPPTGPASEGQFVQCRAGNGWRAWQTVAPIRNLSENVSSARRVRHPVLASVLAQVESADVDTLSSELVSTIDLPLHTNLQALLDSHLRLSADALAGKTEGPPRAGILLIDGLTGEIAAAPSHPRLPAPADREERAGSDRRRLNWNFQPLPVGSAAKVPFAAAILLANPDLGDRNKAPRNSNYFRAFCKAQESKCASLAQENLQVSVPDFIARSSNGYALWLIEQANRNRSPGWIEHMRKLACIEPLDADGDPSCSRYLWRGDGALATRGTPQSLLRLDLDEPRRETRYQSFHSNILGDNRSVWTSANLAQAYARLFTDRAMNPRLTPATDKGAGVGDLYLYGQQGEKLKVWRWLRDGMAGVMASPSGTAKALCSAPGVGCADGHRVGNVWLYAKTGTPTVVQGEDGKVLVLMAARTATGRPPAKPGDITGLKIVVITQRYKAPGKEAVDLAAALFRNAGFRNWLGAGRSAAPANAPAKPARPDGAGR